MHRVLPILVCVGVRSPAGDAGSAWDTTLLTDQMAQAASSSSSTHNKNKQRSGLEGVDLAALHFLFDEVEVVGVEKAGLVDVVLIELS